MSTINLFDKTKTDTSLKILEECYPDYLVNNNIEISNSLSEIILRTGTD